MKSTSGNHVHGAWRTHAAAACAAGTILRERQLRVTKSRVQVLVRLMAAQEPLPADVLAASLGMNLVTLYRILDRLVEAAIVYRADFRGGKAYFEYQPTHHHHVTCTGCGVFEAVDACVDITAAVAGSARRFASVDSHVLEFFGRCKRCAR